MGYRIEWDNSEHTVILQQYTEGASKDDLYHLAKKSNQIMATVSHTVHLIIDERNIELVLTSSDMRYLEKMTPSNQGAVVMIVPQHKLRYKKLVQEIGKNVAPNAFEQPYFAENIEDAQQFLAQAFHVNYDTGQEISQA